MRRYLVVANQTLGGEHLLARIRRCVQQGPSTFHVVVPATHSQSHAFTEGEDRDVAQHRLDQALVSFRATGAEVDGEIGDANPMLAIEDALRGQQFDEIILSTLPPGPSRWLKLDLPHRVATNFHVPVTHLVAEKEPEPERPSGPGVPAGSS
jgi:hypothetical protein